MVRFFLVFLFSISFVYSEDSLHIVAVGEAELEKSIIHFQSLTDSNDKDLELLSEKYISVFKNNFSFYREIISVSNSNRSFIGQLGNSYKIWNDKNFKYVFNLHLSRLTDEEIELKYEGYDVKSEKEIISNVHKVKIGMFERGLIHKISNDLYEAIFNKKSIFNSKILFVSDKNSKGANHVKELFIMDFDGNRKRQLTFHKGTVISPAISYDKSKAIYSLITKNRGRNRNINLYLIDLNTGKSKLISKLKGMNSGAVFLPGDNEIALTLSHTGNAEIYIMNLETKNLKRLTKHYAADVDPSFSIDGEMLAFLSGRVGKAEIFTMNPSSLEKDVKRISFVGDYNATPRFSPNGKQIVFSSWLDNRFDIFRINRNGRGLVRLTKNFGSNEDPTFSNDGEFLAFSSQRVLSKTKAVQNIYVMSKDGEILGPLTKNFGNCITPRWSK